MSNLLSRAAGYVIRRIVQATFTAAAEQRLTETLANARARVCDFQTRYPENRYHLTGLNNELLLLLDNDAKDELVLDEIHSITKQLHASSIMAVQDSANIARDGISGYFSVNGRKASVQPRVCFKAHNDELVVDVQRQNSHDPFHVSENSLLDSVAKEGIAKRINNIPKTAQSDKFFLNKRLSNSRAKTYISPGWFKRVKMKWNKEIVDKEWVDCFDVDENGTKTRPLEDDLRAYYKSSLVVPVTLMNTGNAPEMTKVVLGENSTEPRAILGFVCIDHVKPDFFEEYDELLVWMYADILSLAVIDFVTLVRSSPAMVDAVRLLIQSEDEKYMEFIETIVTDIRADMLGPETVELLPNKIRGLVNNSSS